MTELTIPSASPVALANSETIEWVDADGNTHVLTDDVDMRVLLGVQGRGLPPVDFVTEKVPGQPGEILREVRIGARDVTVPVLLKGNGKPTLRDLIRSFGGALDPSRGDGKLRVTSYDGTQRELTCRYSQGMELDEDESARSDTWQKAILVFRAWDPYWYDATTQVLTWTLGATPATFFPFPPLVLSASEIFADASIDNAGDVEAWPIWQITGPAASVVLRNLTTGKRIDLSSLSLSAGQVLAIDTRPGEKTVTRDGVNVFGSQASGSALWPLARGTNSVRVELSGATAATIARLSYRRRYGVG